MSSEFRFLCVEILRVILRSMKLKFLINLKNYNDKNNKNNIIIF